MWYAATPFVLGGDGRARLEVESLSEMYWRACQLGAPQILSDAQMEEVIDRFRHYGRNRADEDQPR